MPWLAWLLLGLVLIALEVFVPGFFLASVGIAAIIVSIASAVGLTATQQLTVFAVSTGVIYLSFRRVFEALMHPYDKRIATNVDALPGKRGLVREDIRSGLPGGRVAVGGDDWRAVSETGKSIPAGTEVVVVAVEGATLTVRPTDGSS